MNVLTDNEKGLLVLEHLGPKALAHDTMSLLEAFELGLKVAEQEVIKRLAAGVSVEPVASFWRERNQSLYPGISIGLTTAGDALPLGERHKLYDATAIAAARVQENERIVELCKKRWKGGYPQEVIDDLVIAIRALLGKEAQS